MAVVITDNLSDITNKWQPFWHRTAPRRLVERCGPDPKTGWEPWQKHLARRKQPELPPFLEGKHPPLWWGAEKVSGYTLSAINDLVANEKRAMEVPALVALYGAYSLPTAAATLPGDEWWELADRLQSLATDADLLAIDGQADPRDVLRQQLLAGELPLALGYLFPEISSFRELRDSARNVLSEALVQLTDGQGLPHGRLMPVLLPLWASWTRCRWMGERLHRGCWSSEAEVQYQWLVRHVLRLTDADGRLMLTDSRQEQTSVSKSKSKSSQAKSAWPKGLYEMAVSLVGDRADCTAANEALPERIVPKRVRTHARDLPEVSLESEWSGVGVLATGWSRSAARVALNYAEDPVRIELSIGRERLLDGMWTSRTTCDGEVVRPRGEWEQSCWQSDDKCDFLELCLELSHGLKLERQIVLGRKDGVLYLADAVIASGSEPRELTHAIELPIARDAQWQPEKETRDGLIVGHKKRVAVLPMALSEWRTDPRGGRLEVVDGRLITTQSAKGSALYCPLMIDLDAHRAKKERTWRQLTVVESLEEVSRDVAVGFRAQSGREQWLFYRSLAKAGNRTLLGQNIAGEFYAGRVLPDGKMDEWIEIEACA